tara:strand:- start:523 stop:657 length:135 start_codon:yes stop_codon:yes gene_type:complete
MGKMKAIAMEMKEKNWNGSEKEYLYWWLKNQAEKNELKQEIKKK